MVPQDPDACHVTGKENPESLSLTVSEEQKRALKRLHNKLKIPLREMVRHGINLALDFYEEMAEVQDRVLDEMATSAPTRAARQRRYMESEFTQLRRKT